MTKQRFTEEILLALLEKYTGESPTICEDGTPMEFISFEEDDDHPEDHVGVIHALHILCTASPQELENGDWATWDYLSADHWRHNEQVIKEVYVKMIELTQQVLSAKQKLDDDGTIDHLIRMQRILGQVSINLFNENLLNKDEDDIPGWNWWYDLIPEKGNGSNPDRMYPDDQRDDDGVPHWIKEFLLMCERVADRKTMLDDKYREKAVWDVYKGNDAPKKLDVSTIHTIITAAKGLPYMDNFIQHEIKSVCLESNVSEYDITAVRRVLDSCIETGIDGKGDPDHLVQKCDNVLAGIEMGIAMSKKEDSETQ